MHVRICLLRDVTASVTLMDRLVLGPHILSLKEVLH